MNEIDHEGTNVVCPYCDEGSVIVETPDAVVRIWGSVLRLITYTDSDNTDYQQISFCPMCGRKLTEAG